MSSGSRSAAFPCEADFGGTRLPFSPFAVNEAAAVLYPNVLLRQNPCRAAGIRRRPNDSFAQRREFPTVDMEIMVDGRPPQAVKWQTVNRQPPTPFGS
jgi:hypothetical protein